MAMPVMTPCIQRVEDGDGVARYANSAVLIRPDGAHSPPYVKRILVPFSEYLPLEEALPFLRRLFPGAARYEAGKEMVLMDLPGKDVRVIPTICYESVFTRHIRKGVEAGGNLVVNMVDDAWFGPTAASAVHLALGVLRAVEYRVPLVRVTNSGDGVFVGASGRIVPGTRTPSFQTAITVRTLFTPDSRSPYARWGDAVLWGLTVLSGIGWVGLYLGRKGDGKLREADRRLI
jgi:apolipoprotein N-acyltransferase